MTGNIAFSRAVSAAVVLLGLAALGTALAWLAVVNRQALVTERDAKSGFVSRALVTRDGSRAGEGAPSRQLVVLAESDTLAAARIETLVRSVLAEGGCVVLSSRAEIKTGETVRGADGRIVVQASVQGTMEALQASLFRLENGAPLVLADALEIRRPDEAEPQRQPPGSPALAATLTLSAFWKRGPPEKG